MDGRPQPLRVRLGDREIHVAPAATLVIGRAATSGLVIDDPAVSLRHLVVWFDDVWRARSEGRNGTFHNGLQINQLPINAPTTLFLCAPDGIRVDLTPAAAPQAGTAPEGGGFGSQTARHSLDDDLITVGRAPDNTVVLDDLLVSRHHAQLRRHGSEWELVDLGSANGTYLDGARVDKAVVTPASWIGLGHQAFRLQGASLVEFRDSGAIRFEARRVSVTIGGKRLLDEVSFSLDPNSMLVIVGPSGSGKTTLLRALTATAPATSGQVGYGGRDLYSNFEEIRHRLGFVPQDDILHPQLTVRAALGYAARLRFPADVEAPQRAGRVQEVTDELGLREQARQRISTLSGGQRKRTSTAMELLTRPSLLFLDEPTSGLDINRDREVMRMLKSLAASGRTVIVVSHNVTYLDLADRILVLATGGQLAYFGPPQGALAYFGCDDFADMYAQLEQPRTDWRRRFESSNLGPATEPSTQALLGRGAGGADQTPAAIPAHQAATTQFLTLCRRYLAVIAADRQFVGLSIALPLLLALFAHAVPGKAGLSLSTALLTRANRSSPGQLLLVLVLGACLIGSAGAVREIVKERPIFARERSIGLSWGAYLASKAVVLGCIGAVQAVLLAWLGALGDHPSDTGIFSSHGRVELMITLALVTIASMAIGLTVSVAVSNADRVMPLLVLVIMAQLLLSGGLFPLRHRLVLEQLSWLSPARWGFAGGASVIDLERQPGLVADPLWNHTKAAFLGDLYALAALSLAYLVVTAVLLRRVGRLDSRLRRPARRSP